MKNVTVEITMDLDSNRRVWTSAHAEEVEPENVSDMMVAVQCSAQAAYDHAIERGGLRLPVRKPPGVGRRDPADLTSMQEG